MKEIINIDPKKLRKARLSFSLNYISIIYVQNLPTQWIKNFNRSKSFISKKRQEAGNMPQNLWQTQTNLPFFSKITCPSLILAA